MYVYITSPHYYIIIYFTIVKLQNQMGHKSNFQVNTSLNC